MGVFGNSFLLPPRTAWNPSPRAMKTPLTVFQEFASILRQRPELKKFVSQAAQSARSASWRGASLSPRRWKTRQAQQGAVWRFGARGLEQGAMGQTFLFVFLLRAGDRVVAPGHMSNDDVTTWR